MQLLPRTDRSKRISATFWANVMTAKGRTTGNLPTSGPSCHVIKGKLFPLCCLIDNLFSKFWECF